ncbi:hypothetical protein Ait01nite_044610 [Actinoplanes italicus]|uniref:Uncharacterized protein DUF1905 n=1 Tax=Actinoplanes italicus TaxID=113567 RepID=A0A2T0KCG8_9ACTN|nr:DUF1905 domain-containing protein [Actinoplanes italicus]PRX20942.1 uncharacterized protein DUF1905 [Actinoplanes italicus]GIE31416.1 hypothetical protein Ait01nite_044610 [Actinoplanes italicus]
MRLTFDGEIIYWRGPAPHHFVPVPEAECQALADASSLVTYGWGMIPVTVRLGGSQWTTSLFPKDGGYLVPIKAAVRKAESLDAGDPVAVELEIDI